MIGASILAVAALVSGTLYIRQRASHAEIGSSSTTLQSLTSLGTGTFGSDTSGLVGDTVNQTLPPNIDHDQHTNAQHANAPTTNPNPAPNAVSPGSAVGFQGLDHFDTRTRDGGNAFSLEPPDQGLCLGNGFVLEPINDVLVVFDKAGHRLTAPVSMNTFFGLPVAIVRSTGVRGPFLSDPKCLYDAGPGRFFLTILELDPAPSVRAHTLIAVSQTGDPRGSWFRYSIDATDDGQNGTPANAACPCFGDQPLIGLNADGFYISTNEFSNVNGQFNGAQIYAMPKAPLTTGTLPQVVHINTGPIPTPDVGGIWYSIQPATTPPGSDPDHGQLKNTEFFLSALQFGPAPLDNRIAVWSLGNTTALVSGNPMAVKLTNTVISSETYGQPNNATQKAGSYPLGQSLGDPENLLASNDDRMNQVVYADGLLWSGVNTIIGDGSRVGIAYFIVAPDISGGNLSASMAHQGYVSLAGDSVLFPSIGVTSAGKGAMTFSVSGPDYYPSAAYTLIDATNGAGDVHIAGAGVGPSDGFSGYPQFGGGGVSRWGDYSAAVADSDGSIWFATEYIAGGPRTSLANWSTFIGNVTP